ncbi:hypothetical protein EV361DRAFT_954291 [Lentinula raphanica]|nr:hypothetical protein EV361DRAFT_954291 [Lentinula raphanica]
MDFEDSSSDDSQHSNSSDQSDDWLSPRRHLVELIQEFDAARATLLAGRAPDTNFNELDRASVQNYINLVLCGIPEDRYQYTLVTDDSHQHLLWHPDTTLTRDIDSALIFRERFPWTTSYDVLTTYHSGKSLKDHLHAQVSFTNPAPGSEPQYRDPGTDANVLWGVCGNNGGRNRIYLMLPGAENEVMTDLHPLIYDATLNAARSENAFATTTWSPNYEAELNRTARFTQTRFRTESRKQVPAVTGTAFANAVMTAIRQHPWGSGAYWFIQIRGAKDLTRDHHFDHLTQAQLDLILDGIDLDQSIIYLDLGIEIHLPDGYAAMPDRRNESHAGLAETLWGIDPQQDWDYDDYAPDCWAGVADIAGFRCNFAGGPRTPNRISYVQVYTTDKFQTYNASGTYGGALQLFGPAVLKMKGPDDVPLAISKVYSATQKNLSDQTPTASRFEARVPLQHARALDRLGYNRRELRPSDLADFLIVLPSRAIWAWRIHRLYGCYLLIKYAASMSLEAKRDPQYLTLVAAVVYLFNSIHSRPGEMSWQRALAKVLFDVKSIEEIHDVIQLFIISPKNPNHKVPYMTNGALWLPEISFPVPNVTSALRFTFNHKMLTEAQLGNALGMKFRDIIDLYTESYLKQFKAKGMSRKRTKPSDPPIRNRTITLPRGVRDGTFLLPPAYFDHGPDLPPAAMVGDAPPDDPILSYSNFFIGYLNQIMQRVGTIKKTHIRYCKVEDIDILRMNPDTYRDMNISTYFTSYQFTTKAKDWSANFETLFPARDGRIIDITNAKLQGWRGVSSYRDWLKARAADPNDKKIDFPAMRRFCYDMYHSLKWFPKVSSDRVIDNSKRTTWTHVFSGDLTTGTPITFNPKFFGEGITAIPNLAPVLSPQPVDENEAEFQQLRQDHQGTVPAIAQHTFGDQVPEPEDDEPQEPSRELMEWARRRYRNKRGRVMIDLDSDMDEETQVINQLLQD